MWSDIPNSVFRDNIEGNRLIEVPQSVRKIIDTREFQRLRDIRQMGLSYLVFPTAEHSRFSHSLGVYATANQAFRHLQKRAHALDLQTAGFKFDEYSHLEFCIAALCHDIGHSAFSHVLETVLLPDDFRNHEDCTKALLLGDTEIARAVKSVADLDAVVNLLNRRHPNKALGDLISSTFDVDRCDYILRDSRMAGVEYGQFDLKWLFHAMTVETNTLGQPVLLLDGPRGLDALRQFLSARRYMHRQVYFHPTIRGAQLLLKGIFTRMQDIGDKADLLRLVPRPLAPLTQGKKLSLDDFIETTDGQISYMIRALAADCADPVLKYLASLFISRRIPKCVLDTARMSGPLSEEYRINPLASYEAGQGELIQEFIPATLEQVTEEIRSFVAKRFAETSIPEEAASYLVGLDPAQFVSTPPTDLLFSFKGRIVSFEEIGSDAVGFDMSKLLESFTITRLFVPRDFLDEARECVQRKFGIASQSTESGGRHG